MSPLLPGPGQLRALCSFRLTPTDGAERLLATEHVVSHSWFANMMYEYIFVYIVLPLIIIIVWKMTVTSYILIEQF
jgi:hypothetical protein